MVTWLRAFLFFQLVLVTSFAGASRPAIPLNGTTLYGEEVHGSGVAFFGGITYAQAARFQPAILQAVSGTADLEKEATAFGKACPQPLFFENLTLDDLSEDCLTLNIFAPTNLSPKTLIPVLVWIHPGAYVQGSSSLFNASGIVSRSIENNSPVMVVSINFRVGPWGFPQGEAATAADALNLGLRDQIIALQWIQYNIQQFGGDSRKVTLFGQSAGGSSIQDHHYNPENDALFAASIMQSPTAVAYFNSTVREAYWTTLSQLGGCNDTNSTAAFECLRALPEQTFYNATLPLFEVMGDVVRNGSYPFVPVVDGKIIPDQPSSLIKSGLFLRKPFISGTTQDEGTYFAPFGLETADDFTLFLEQNTNPFASSLLQSSMPGILELYPDDPNAYTPVVPNDTFIHGRQFKRVSAVAMDAALLQPRREFSSAAANTGVPVYSYYFTAPESVSDVTLGVSHSAELPFLFNNLPIPQPGHTADLLSTTMMDLWIHFASEHSFSDSPVGNISAPIPWLQYGQNSTVLEFTGGDNVYRYINDTFRIQQTSVIQENPILFAHKK